MTDTPTDPTAPPEGNAIVPTPPSALRDVGFPMLVFAAVIVGAGVYYVAQIDARAGWLLAFLLLLSIAFAYPNFSSELTNMLGGSGASNAAANAATTGGTNGVATPTSALGG